MATPQSREDYIYFARLSEQAERYEDMIKYMKEAANVSTIFVNRFILIFICVQYDQDLSNDERNLLSVAYKNSVKTRRDAWRTIQAIQNKEELKVSRYFFDFLIAYSLQANKFLFLITQYKDKIEQELQSICQDVLNLLDDNLLKKDEIKKNPEAVVFFQKMKGDYYRYLGEFKTGDDRKQVIEKAQDSYKVAVEEAEKLKTTHPIRLGLALNYSVFYYEILNQPDVACKLAKTAFDNAISDLETLDEEEYRDSATIMQLLRDNLTLWTSDLVEGHDNRELQEQAD